jgi:glyoxylase-like metal-dependent hydrolase (beta-lactamase superfamily II)
MAKLNTLTHRSTHAYLMDCRDGKLLVDPGWPGTLPVVRSSLKRYQVEPSEIKYLFATHFHPDHAGLVQEVKIACGARLIIHSRQVPIIDAIPHMHKLEGSFVPIQVDRTDLIVDGLARKVLESIGVPGVLIETPGHSEDSVSLVLDNGAAFIGDLTWPDRVSPENSAAVFASWQALINVGAQTIYPGHGGPMPITFAARLLPAAE